MTMPSPPTARHRRPSPRYHRLRATRPHCAGPPPGDALVPARDAPSQSSPGTDKPPPSPPPEVLIQRANQQIRQGRHERIQTSRAPPCPQRICTRSALRLARTNAMTVAREKAAMVQHTVDLCAGYPATSTNPPRLPAVPRTPTTKLGPQIHLVDPNP